MDAIGRLFNLRPEDRPVLPALAPIFALVTGANVVTMSFAKALFIANNDKESLPWMFIGAALVTALASLTYVALMGRATVARRFKALLWLAVSTFAVLAVLARTEAAALSLVIFTWCTGLGQLTVIQAWGFSTAALETRRARRLFPIFAAAATLGAAAGGGLTRAMLPVVGLTGLLFMACALLAATAWAVGRAAKRFRTELAEAEAAQADDPTEPNDGTARPPGLRSGLAALARIPLLRGIAALAFCTQVASVTLDFQFAASLKDRYDGAAMAGFLGIYYAAANLLTLILALAGGSRLVRGVGLGPAAGAAAAALAVGSAVAVGFATGGETSIFWFIAATSFAERVLSFGVSRHAVQAAYSPVAAHVAERARFLVDGVVHRLATIAPSAALLFAPALLVDYGALSPFVLGAAVFAVAVAFGLGRSYRRALFDGLRERRVEATDAVAPWAGGEARGVLRTLLSTGNPDDVLQGLELARELGLHPPANLHQRLLTHVDPRVVAATMETLAQLEVQVPPAVLLARLGPLEPPAVLRAVLQLLPRERTDAAPRIEPLVHHEDPTVAALAYVWIKRATARHHTVGRLLRYEMQVMEDLTSGDEELQRRAVAEVHKLALPEYAAPLMDALEHPQLRPLAQAALERLPRQAVVTEAERRLAETGGASGVWLVRCLERCATAEAVATLVGQLGSRSELVRSQVVTSLDRMARRDDLPPLDAGALGGQLAAEVAALQALTTLDAAARALAPSPGRELLLRDVGLHRASAERRAFRLVGLMTSRPAMRRALLHYRAGDRRSRSNAIELVDSMGDAPELEALVAYLEGTRTRGGASTTLEEARPEADRVWREQVEAHNGDPHAALRELLGGSELAGWLLRLYHWAAAGQRAPADLPFERIRRLADIPLFARIPSRELAPVAQLARPVRFAAGSAIFDRGAPSEHLFVVTSGRVSVRDGDATVATLGPDECFGEMGVLDDAPRSASVVAEEPTQCLRLSKDDFDNLLELFPSLGRGIIDVLARRLRDALGRSDAARVAERRDQGAASSLSISS